MRRRNVNDPRIQCNIFGPVPPDIVTCGTYMSKKDMTLPEMEMIAILIDPRPMPGQCL